jgi:hypothetical protein
MHIVNSLRSLPTVELFQQAGSALLFNHLRQIETKHVRDKRIYQAAKWQMQQSSLCVSSIAQVFPHISSLPLIALRVAPFSAFGHELEFFSHPYHIYLGKVYEVAYLVCMAATFYLGIGGYTQGVALAIVSLGFLDTTEQLATFLSTFLQTYTLPMIAICQLFSPHWTTKAIGTIQIGALLENRNYLPAHLAHLIIKIQLS